MTIDIQPNARARERAPDPERVAFMDRDAVARAGAFHASFPEHVITPLHDLPRLADRLGLGRVWVKDEAARFGLNAFKALGAAYAMARELGRRCGLPPTRLTLHELADHSALLPGAPLTFVTATDGNHGHGVAWAARRFGHRAVVLLPAGTAPTRVARVRAQGAEATVTDVGYDATVRLARLRAEERGWILIQDTAWPGYERNPRWIMQGYGTLFEEAFAQIADAGAPWPTHVLVQAGVGSLAGALVAWLAARFGADRPAAIVIEPHVAACHLASVRAGDGAPHAATGPLETEMAGLACGEPNHLSWPLLRDLADAFAACDDAVAIRGMQLLARPAGDDPPVVSGASGAVGVGLLDALCGPGGRPAEGGGPGLNIAALGLDAGARVLALSTEGDTDPEAYRRVVSDGEADG